MPTAAESALLTVYPDGKAGPYVIVAPDQYGPVTEALGVHRVRYHLDEYALLLNRMPPLTILNLDTAADLAQVQQLLDRVAASLPAKARPRREPPTQMELVLRGDWEAMGVLRQRLEVGSEGEWTRRPDIEERHRNSLPQGTTAFCFSKQVPAVGRPATVFLQGRGPGEEAELYVSGVFSQDRRGRFDPDQYDQVITDFRNTLIEPLVRGLGIRLIAMPTRVGPVLEDVFSWDAMAKLKAFSAFANQSDFQSLDMQKWARFVSLTHLDNAAMELDLLASWLEDEGFPQEQRDRLIKEFESGRQLLSAYDEERRKQCPQ